jgi:bleomycin hydrolase
VLRSIMLTTLLLGLFSCASVVDQDSPDVQEKEAEGFTFQREVTVPCTSVKHQDRTGTCWAFATTSFLEAELLRCGKGELDLSEMFVVRNAYPRKARQYVRLHGKSPAGPGGLSGDVLSVLREVGLVPEEVYPGLLEGESRHDHGEMGAVLGGMLQAIVSKRGGFVSPVWEDAVQGVLDAYLGAQPTEFTHDGKSYTPRTFADELELDPDQYLEFTSFTHHPFYRQICLEIPDNWARHLSWNIPLDEMMEIIDRSLERGYSVAWDGDTSEKGFQHKKGVAILPAKAWADRSEEEQEAIGDAPETELAVTQELRQLHFDRYDSTDDHLMHLVGTARDQRGTKYYLAKNSWGTRNSEYDGFLHLSEAYVRSKGLLILVHRDVVPEEIAGKISGFR